MRVGLREGGARLQRLLVVYRVAALPGGLVAANLTMAMNLPIKRK